MRSAWSGTVLAIVLCALPAAALAIPVARLQLWSEPGDYVGQGGTWDLTYERPADSVVAQISSSLAGGVPTGVSFILGFTGPTFRFASLGFSTRRLGPMQPGFYDDAVFIPEPVGHPGMNVALGSRATQGTGHFTIQEVTFIPGTAPWTIDTFAVDFVQYGENSSAALVGRFEYRLAGIPEPGTAMLTSLGLAWIAGRSRQRVRPG